MIKLNDAGYVTAVTFPQVGTEDAYRALGFRDDLHAPEDIETYRWDGEQWVFAPKAITLPFAVVQQNKVSEIDKACRSTILSGFTSYALGAEYCYPAKLTDQSNLSGSILASMLPETPADWVTPFWCADVAGVWAFRTHTITQIQQVGRDAKQATLLAMSKNEQLQTQIALASSIEELNQISW